MTEEVPHDEAAERAVLGCVLLSDTALDPVLDLGLRPEHFWRPTYARLWEAVINLRMREQAIDPITVSAEAERLGVRPPGGAALRPFVHSLPNEVPSVSHYTDYARSVLDLAGWRQRLKAGRAMQEAALKQDEEGWALAQRMLDSRVQRSKESLTAEQWAEVLSTYFEAEKIKSIPMPFYELTNALGGGMRGGELMLLAGYTSHGKSIIADQMLDAASREGYRCHLYMTEMTAIERGLRLLSRRSGVSFGRMRSRKLSQEDRNKIARELDRLPHGCTITSDWSIDDVYRDVMRSHWDLVVIDLIHGFPYKDERELDYLSKMSLRMAKASTTAGEEGTAVVSVAHLNESQMSGTSSPARPKPSLRSIKGSSSLKQDADFVTFVWLEDDSEGTPKTNGVVFVAKGRNTGTSHVDVILNPRRMAFEPVYQGGLIP